MHKNWDDLRLFLAVARAQSLSAAGRVVGLDPATLGRRIARLEKALDVVLFVKSPQGYALTQAGEVLRTRSVQVEEAMRLAAGSAAQGEDLSGQVRIGAPDGCANYLLPQICTQISRENPLLDIQIVALPRVFNLTRQEADMAIGVSAPTAGRLLVQKVTEYHLHLAASRGYLERAPVLACLEDLKRHPLVGYIPDMIFDSELDYLADLGTGRVPMASNSVSVQVNMLRQGAGVGVVHDFSLPFAPELQKVLVQEVSLTRAFYLIRHAGDERNPRLNKLASALARGLRAEVSRLEGQSQSADLTQR